MLRFRAQFIDPVSSVQCVADLFVDLSKMVKFAREIPILFFQDFAVLSLRFIFRSQFFDFLSQNRCFLFQIFELLTLKIEVIFFLFDRGLDRCELCAEFIMFLVQFGKCTFQTSIF